MDICAVNNQFAIDAFLEISRNAIHENVVFSPLSIVSVLSMVYLGAKGDTAAQIAKALHFSNVKDVHSKSKSLWEELMKESDGHVLINANRIFGQKTFEFVSSFVEDTKNLYCTGLEQLDFQNNAEESRQHINQWISQQTNGKIQELLPKKSISPNTALVIANTLYFSANWTKQFRESRTREETFTLLSNEQVKVKMMFMTNYLKSKYIANPGIKIVELPYGTNEDFSMVILIPDNNRIFIKVKKIISLENLNAWINFADIKMSNIALYLPKFKVEKQMSLKETLTSMGITDAFSQVKADFSGMTKQGHMYMSEAYHQTSLEVNEEGTEASSATGSVMSFRSLPNDEIKANHPFFVVIRHKYSNAIILFGAVNKP